MHMSFRFVVMRTFCFPKAGFVLANCLPVLMGDGHCFIIWISYSDIVPNSLGKSLFCCPNSRQLLCLWFITEPREGDKRKVHCHVSNWSRSWSSNPLNHIMRTASKDMRPLEDVHLSQTLAEQHSLLLPFLQPRNSFSYCSNSYSEFLNPLNPELNPICYLLALLGAYHFLHVSRIRVKLLTFRLLMSYIYGEPILDVSRSHTTTQHSR